MFNAGCGLLLAAVRSLAFKIASEISPSFQYMVPSGSTARSIGGTSAGVGLVWGLAFGRSILTLCDISGAVIMKMISNTSITSASGVTLISAPGISRLGSPPVLMDMASSSLLEADLLHVVTTCFRHHFRQIVVLGFIGGLDMDLRLLIERLGTDRRELCLQVDIADRHVVPRHRAVRLDEQGVRRRRILR